MLWQFILDCYNIQKWDFLISEEMPGFDGKEVFEHYTTSQNFVIILGAKLKWASLFP